jgi:hypothetical protein
VDAQKYKVGDKVSIARPPETLRVRAGVIAEVMRINEASGKILVRFTQDAGVSSNTWWIEADCLDRP